jgi:hypothetical protein
MKRKNCYVSDDVVEELTRILVENIKETKPEDWYKLSRKEIAERINANITTDSHQSNTE